jgi:hypothetical protein
VICKNIKIHVQLYIDPNSVVSDGKTGHLWKACNMHTNIFLQAFIRRLMNTFFTITLYQTGWKFLTFSAINTLICGYLYELKHWYYFSFFVLHSFIFHYLIICNLKFWNLKIINGENYINSLTKQLRFVSTWIVSCTVCSFIKWSSNFIC